MYAYTFISAHEYVLLTAWAASFLEGRYTLCHNCARSQLWVRHSAATVGVPSSLLIYIVMDEIGGSSLVASLSAKTLITSTSLFSK